MNTLIMLRGGHTTVVKGVSPSQLERELRDFDSNRKATNGLYYVNLEDGPDNRLIVDPQAIVALVASA